MAPPSRSVSRAKGTISSPSAERVERLAALRAKLGAERVHTVELDVRDAAAVQAAVAALPPALAAIDVLVNNAGLALGLAPAQQADLSDWERMVDTNVKGLMTMTRTVLPGMVARNRGHVINIGSVAAAIPIPAATSMVAPRPSCSSSRVTCAPIFCIHTYA